MSIFRFPRNIDDFQTVINLKDLKTRLKRQTEETGQIANQNLLTLNRGTHLYVICKFQTSCRWKMMYTERFRDDPNNAHSYLDEKQKYFALTKFWLTHVHIQSPNFPIPSLVQTQLPHTTEDKYLDIIECLNDLSIHTHHINYYCSYLTGISPATARVHSHAYRNSRFQKSMTNFEQWYDENRKKFFIFTYPERDKLIYLPDMVFLSCKSAKQIYSQKGQVMALRVLENKILEMSQKCEKFSCIVLYGYTGCCQIVLYGFCIVVSDRYEPLSEIQVKTERGLKQEKDLEYNFEGNQREIFEPRHYEVKKQHKQLSENIYKTLKIFFQLMGNTCQTIIVEDTPIICKTVEHFIKVQQKEIKMITDPFDFMMRYVPENLQNVIIRLIKAYDPEEYAKIYERAVGPSSEYSKQEHKILEVFNSRRDQYCVYDHKDPKFVGMWFEQDEKKLNNPMIDIKTPKRNVVEMLLSIGESFIHNAQSYQDRISLLVEHSTVQKLVPYDFVRPGRLWVYKQGFRLMMAQLRRTIDVDIIGVEFQGEKLREYQGNKGNFEIRHPEDEQPLITEEEVKQIRKSNPHYKNEDLKKLKQIPKLHSDSNNGLNEKQMSNEDLLKIGMNKSNTALFPQYVRNQDQRSLHSFFSSKNQYNPQNEREKLAMRVTENFNSWRDIRETNPFIERIQQRFPTKITFREGDRMYECVRKTYVADEVIVDGLKPKYEFRYDCTCNFTKFRGIPCRHLLKIAIKFRLKVFNYVSKYWKLSQPYNLLRQFSFYSRGLQIPKRGKPRRSKRHSMRH